MSSTSERSAVSKIREGVLSIGVISADRFLQVPAVPDFDEKVNGKDLGWFTGGMCPNFSVAARQVGVRSGVITVFGGDAESAAIRDDLHRLGVETEGSIVMQDKKCWWSLTLLDEQREKALVVVESDLPLPPAKAVITAPLDTWQLVYPLTIDARWCTEIGRAAKAAGCLVTFDIEPHQIGGEWGSEEFTAMLRTADIVFIKRSSLVDAGFKDVREGAVDLLKTGPSIVIVTSGSQDTYCATPNGSFVVTPPQVEVVDSTGAGDAFAGAFCAAYVQGKSVELSLTEATALGALSVQSLGCQSYAPADQFTLQSIRGQVVVRAC
jgi:ribokinase